MKTTQLPTLVAAALAMPALSAVAGTTWDGEGADASWGTATNWSGDTLPAFDGSEAIDLGTGFGSGLATTLDGDRHVTNVLLSTALAVDINPGTPASSRLILQGGDFVRTGTGNNRQVINCDIELGASGNFRIRGDASAVEEFNGTISDGGNGYAIDTIGASRTLQLDGTNTFSGGFSLDAGQVYFSSDQPFGTGTININSSGGFRPLGNGRTLTNNINFNASQFTFGNNGGNGCTFAAPGVGRLYTDLLLRPSQSSAAGNDLVFANGIADDGNNRGLQNSGSRNVRIEGASTYTGPTVLGTVAGGTGYLIARGTMMTTSVTLYAGRLIIGADNPVGTGKITIDDVATTTLRDYGARYDLDNDIDMAGTVEFAVNATSRLDFNENGGTSTLTGDVIFNHRSSAGSTVGPQFFAGLQETGGSFGITLTGTASRYLTLNGPCTYTGPTTVNRAILRMGSVNALPTNTELTVNLQVGTTDGAFYMNGFDTRVGGLAGDGYVHNGGATLTVGGASTNSFSGSMVSGGGLVKTGTGDQRLAASMAYGGATIVSGGVLRVDGDLTSSAATVSAIGAGILAGSGTVGRAVLVTSGGGIGAGDSSNSVGTLTIAATVALTNGSRIVWAQGTNGNDVVAADDIALADAITLLVYNLGVDVAREDEFVIAAYSNSLAGFDAGQWSIDGSHSTNAVLTSRARVFTNVNQILVTGLIAPPPPAGTVVWVR